MIDTIRIGLSGEWAPRNMEGWKCKDDIGFRQEDGSYRPGVLYSHEESGLRIGGKETPTWLECSLPRVAYRSNGRLLASPAAVVEAWGQTKELAGQVIDLEAVGQPTRVDLVWQFRTDARAVLLAMNGARHPKIRSTPKTFFGQTCEWSSPSAGLTLRAYDKHQEVNGCPGDVLRCESEIRGKSLKGSAMSAVGGFPFIRWQDAWSHYREQWIGLPAFRFRDSDKPLSMAGFLALLRTKGVNIDGVSAADVYLQARTQRHQRKLLNQMANAEVQELLEFDPGTAFPVEGPPEPVEVLQGAA